MMSIGRARNGRLYLAAAPLVLGAAILVFVLLGSGLPWPSLTVQGMVLDGETGAPVATAVARTNWTSARTDQSGGFTLDGAKLGGSVTIAADGYRSARVNVGFGSTIRTVLQPLVVDGTIKDAESGAPVYGATVRLGDHERLTDESGAYRFVRPRSVRDLTVTAD